MSGEASGPAERARSPDVLEREAVDVGLNFLSYRPRTRREVQRKLAEWGYPGATVEAVLRRLSAVGLVDDEAFVAAYVRDRIAHRPMGTRRMVQELYAKGIPREVSLPAIEAVLREEETDERALARRMAERRRRAQRGRDPEKSRRQLRHALIRRGFDAQLARDVVGEVFPPEADRG